ncbi:MAG: AAA family ATPase [Thermoleophilaceae bacterium]
MPVREQLWSWFSQQAAWQQDLARRLAGRVTLEGDAYDDALRVVLAAHGALGDAEEAPAAQELSLEALPGSAEEEGARLVVLGRLRGVGAVAPDQSLSFLANGLTIVYGPNAAGKTSYVRALKRVCRTVDYDEELLGNVFADDPGAIAPTALVEVETGGDRRSRQIDLLDPQETYKAVSVFDARCAELYVSGRNVVAYVPSALLLLARLASTQDQMRRSIQQRINALRAQAPAFPEFTDPSAAKTLVDTLSANTDLQALDRLASLNETDRTRLMELRAVVAASQAPNTRSDLQAAEADIRQARELAERMRELRALVSADAAQHIRALAANAAQAQEAADIAAKVFVELPVHGVGAEPWRRMWEAARSFIESGGGAFPPGSGSHCPLCQQPIGSEDAERLEHFERHVRDDVSERARGSRAAIDAALATLDEGRVNACRTAYLISLREREQVLATAIEQTLAAIAERMRILKRSPEVETELPGLGDAEEQLERWVEQRDSHAETLRSALTPERLPEVRAELADLDGREKLGARQADVEVHVSRLVKAERLEAAHSALATNRITMKQREFSEQLVTDTLAGNLERELRNLHCTHVPVELRPHVAVGETHVDLRLAGARAGAGLREILSEGERRAVSLAFFFAEVAQADNGGGIVVDDPVSSLDTERREYIATRLATEATTRQVIVFTHDLAFMLDLVEQAEAAGLEPHIQAVWRLGDQVGRVDDHPPFHALKFRERVARLTERVEQWDNQPDPADFDDAWRRICDFYMDMRNAWERAVEERLFRGIVQRFQRGVQTLRLRQLNVTDEIIDAIEEGMTRCSHFVHDSPPALGTRLPGRRELTEDVNKLREFEQTTRR